MHKADEQYYITSALLLDVASRSKELFIGSEPDEKRVFLQLVFQNLFVKDGKLQFTMHKPFDSIFKTGKSLKWGGYASTILNSLYDKLVGAKSMVKPEFNYS